MHNPKIKATIYWESNLRHSYSPIAKVGELIIKAVHNEVINGQGRCEVEGYIKGAPETILHTTQRNNGQIILDSSIDYSRMKFVPKKLL